MPLISNLYSLQARNSVLIRASGLDILQSIPSQYLEEIQEPAAKEMLNELEIESVHMPEGGMIQSTYVGPIESSLHKGPHDSLQHLHDDQQ